MLCNGNVPDANSDSESIEINDMIDLLLKVLKSLKDVGQKESFLKFMELLASGTFPLHNICYLLFLDIVEWFSCRRKAHLVRHSSS
jgi:hypothetical protein